MSEIAAFETWAARAVPQPSFAGKYVRGGEWSYRHNIMALMWDCWRAAQRAADSERHTSLCACSTCERQRRLGELPAFDRDSDTHPKDGDVKQAPLVSGAGRKASPNLQHPKDIT